MTDVISLNERRKYPRVSDAVALRLDEQHSDLEIPLDPNPTHIVKISCGGMRFLHNSQIDAGTDLCISMYLSSSQLTVQLNSRVISSGEDNTSAKGKSESHFVQVEFQNINTDTKQLLEDHIDYLLEKTGVINRANRNAYQASN